MEILPLSLSARVRWGTCNWTGLYFMGFFVMNWVYAQLPTWTAFLSLVIMLILLVSMLLSDFFNHIGKCVLTFLAFEGEFEKKGDDADFGKLPVDAKRIGKLAKYYNMEISTYSLSLGLTVSFLENKEETKTLDN